MKTLIPILLFASLFTVSFLFGTLTNNHFQPEMIIECEMFYDSYEDLNTGEIFIDSTYTYQVCDTIYQ